MEMSYEDMKDLMRILDNAGIDYEFGNNYGHELRSDGRYEPYILGHYIKFFDKRIDTWDIDDEDDKWNRG